VRGGEEKELLGRQREGVGLNTLGAIFENRGRSGFDRAGKARLSRVEAHAGLVKSVQKIFAERNYALAA
jgi:hypothetical protein